MKLSVFPQSYWNRRTNSFRSSPPLDPSSDGVGAGKSPSAVFWLVLHGICCLVSLVLGFRFSRIVLFFLFSASATNFYSTAVWSSGAGGGQLLLRPLDALSTLRNLESSPNRTAPNSRVVVGRQGIRIRPWPHPNPVEVMRAHQLIERVQKEQRLLFGVKSPKTVIAVTPTYVRTFQALHLTGVMHSVMLVPYDVVWIVVEAGGTTNETASIIAKSGLRTIHVGFDQRMPNTWDDRHKSEIKMRLRALRAVREERLDGIVVFADDSNIHSMELFDEIQNVKWFGAVSVGILAHSGNADELSALMNQGEQEEHPSPVQGPSCDASDKLVGWRSFDTQPYAGKSAVHIVDKAAVMPGRLEWSGFVLNSRMLWKEDVDDKPSWVKDLDLLLEGNEEIDSPLSLVKDPSMVEPLGSCGRQVLLWWLRVEARADSKFPPGWIINPPLEITIPSKRTPWPDSAPELPVAIKEGPIIKSSTSRRSMKLRGSKPKSKMDHFHINSQLSSTSTQKNKEMR
ncbi:PREDICTED: probable beta-1,4-xylosyltransferase IRX14H [Tarenaya hassleriana]|uniref:probable beta-1,4-xylosyltransferase IRX14H n=1 Tax=Tarenaya hassleriana TaxID=28532 RepID=UPI00053C7358|nr:PREDICTED: probable beta-1,4-xylosyltransferase IRX14H [Tarenaya hassleriana]